MQQSLEERVAFLEGRMQDQAAMFGDLRDGIRELRDDTRRQFAELRDDVGRRFDELRDDVEQRFDSVGGRFDAVDRRFDVVGGQLTDMRQEMVRLDEKVDRHFTWLVGIQVGSLLAVVSAIAGLYLR